jgi:hypothetical protein
VVRIFQDITPELVVFIPGIFARQLSTMRSIMALRVHNFIFISIVYFVCTSDDNCKGNDEGE